MPNKITEAFHRAKSENRTAIVPFVTVGHPEIHSTVAVVEALSEAGADVIELGIPFSDPLAEGPVIQKSSFKALTNGVTPATCLDTVAQIRQRGIQTPIAFMGYYNPIYQMGLNRFCSQAKDAGADGLIAADLPTAESKPLLEACEKNDLALIPLLALTSTDKAIKSASIYAQGFVYCISVLGVTGARKRVSAQVHKLVEDVRAHTELPVAVGFGISNSQHVQDVGNYADGAVVGSALVNAIDNAPANDAPKVAATFIESLKI